MNKSALIKIAGILVGSFVIITLLTFFLYPYLNEQNYEQVQSERAEREPSNEFGSDDNSLFDGENRDLNMNGNNISMRSDSAAIQDSLRFSAVIDSLMAVNDSLSIQLNTATTDLENLENALLESGADQELLASAKEGEPDVSLMIAPEEPKEEFSERVKSLLNLDEEDLQPIANQMTQEELVKIYSSSGNLQREKLLRSLSPERAAKLMQEIML